MTNDELANALWPDRLPDTWEAALRGVLTEVRRFLSEAGLDPAVLGTMHRGHRMLLPTGVTVDLDDARAALAAARTGLADGAAAAAAALAARASSLARLPFLPNHEGEWVDGIRRELESIHARALELEARAAAAAGDLGRRDRRRRAARAGRAVQRVSASAANSDPRRRPAIAPARSRPSNTAETSSPPSSASSRPRRPWPRYRAAVDHDVSPIARPSSTAPSPSLPSDLAEPRRARRRGPRLPAPHRHDAPAQPRSRHAPRGSGRRRRARAARAARRHPT